MSEPLVPGGYILLSRKLIESEIMSKPPLYLKVWVWLLLKAQHSLYKGLERGSCKTSMPQIIEAMSYKVGYRTEKPTKREIQKIIEWLRNPHEGSTTGNMMVTTKVTQGFVYKVLNYNVYQDPNNYEGYNEKVTKEQRSANNGSNNNKNETITNKPDKNEVKEESIHSEVIGYLNIILDTKFKATETCKGFINARVKEGATIEDFEKVIDKKHKDWKDTTMAKYLRPQTLFGTKFDSYLNEKDDEHVKSFFEMYEDDQREEKL